MSKFKSYTQDGVTATMWCYNSIKVKLRWNQFDSEFPRDDGFVKTGVGALFALFIVPLTGMKFDKTVPEWAQDFRAWWKAFETPILEGQFKAAWEAFEELDGDHILEFISKAYEETRREYTPASPELQSDETDTQDADFLAADVNASPTTD